ncbi:hypothetical protein [uncultured Streptomyces sp.]|uniref:hypothetical protein n=1 Tax=uncultured Streptomyces sp. TaxID=174707 RepID=UPI0026292BB0|nr:hypothetical protein [uncultured Streptomyces sp.]
MGHEVWRESADNEAASAVFHLVQRLIDRYGTDRPVMPLVVVQAAESDADGDIDARVARIVHQVHRANRPRRVPVRLLGGGGSSPYQAALDMVRALAEEPWESRGESQYKPLTFPRSRLLGAIEQATAVVQESNGSNGGSSSAAGRSDRVLEQLRMLRWRPARQGRRTPVAPEERWEPLRRSVGPETFLGAVFIAVLSALVTEVDWRAVVTMAVCAALGIAGVRILTTAAPPLLWLRRASRWFATTSSLAAASTRYPPETWSPFSPHGSWQVLRARAATVADRVADASGTIGADTEEEEEVARITSARQFHLELRVQALLEDLRDNYRPHALDWRRAKRTAPPVVLLPAATAENGGVSLINAINNVRSRRSEVDPLLLLAALPAAHVLTHTPSVPAWDQHADGVGPPGGAQARYQRWANTLSFGQSPADAARLAWVLRLPLSTNQLRHEHAHAELRTLRVRRTWAWFVMSRAAVALVLVAGLLGTYHWSDVWRSTYCQGELADRSTDAVRVGRGTAAEECIGVATSAKVRFAEGNDLRLGGIGAGISFDRIERAIREQNEDVGTAEHVTVVYAGPLTAPREADTRKGLEELAGVYIKQSSVNSEPGVKLKVLLANGGRGMLRQTIAVEKIIEVARKDPHVVGVVGLGRNTTESRQTVRALLDAGIPVVDTTNSSSELDENLNYFGLAATDEEQTWALKLLAGQLARKAGAGQSPGSAPRAAVLSRTPLNEEKDQYTNDQHDAGTTMLKEAGYSVQSIRYSLTQNGGAALDSALAKICTEGKVTETLYFAGRMEDVSPLMAGLFRTPGCSAKHFDVFTGDDMTKAGFGTTRSVASNVTVYYTSLTPVSHGLPTDFYLEARTELGKLVGDGGPLPSAGNGRGDGPKDYEDGLFASGQTILSYSAATALYTTAAQREGPRSAARTWGQLASFEQDGMPTGTISLARTPSDVDGHLHGLALVKAFRSGEKTVTATVCLKPAGPEYTDRLTTRTCRP